MLDNEWGFTQHPFVPGHELVGIVDAVGPHAKGAAVGQKSISSSPGGSPATMAKMLEFAARHKINPTIETYPFSEVNEAMKRLRHGKPRYRIVLKH
jgi:uncharacterized zinc-type alcohol dehydrogenase-like protein